MNKEEEKGWLSEKVKCDLCGYEWIAVYHIDCDKLECTNCGNMAHVEIVNDD